MIVPEFIVSFAIEASASFSYGFNLTVRGFYSNYDLVDNEADNILFRFLMDQASPSM